MKVVATKDNYVPTPNKYKMGHKKLISFGDGINTKGKRTLYSCKGKEIDLYRIEFILLMKMKKIFFIYT